MEKYVTDTHALLWYLVGSPRLGKRARAAFDAAVAGDAEIIIPAIVVAELVMFAEKYRTIRPDMIFSKLQTESGFQIVPLMPETAAKIHDLIALPDIHDRLIAAEALYQKCALITFDQRITDSSLVEVVW